MIYDSKPISLEEKGELIHVLNDFRLRSAITDVFQEITAPRLIGQLDCLNLIADIIRFILTLFVHENKPDFELLGAILDSS